MHVVVCMGAEAHTCLGNGALFTRLAQSALRQLIGSLYLPAVQLMELLGNGIPVM